MRPGAAYEQAVKLKPRYATALNNLGNAWKHLGDPEKALEFYGKAIDVDRSYADAWANSGSAHLLRSRHPDAERCLSEALRLNPQSVEALCNMAWSPTANSKPPTRPAKRPSRLPRRRR